MQCLTTIYYVLKCWFCVDLLCSQNQQCLYYLKGKAEMLPLLDKARRSLIKVWLKKATTKREMKDDWLRRYELQLLNRNSLFRFFYFENYIAHFTLSIYRRIIQAYLLGGFIVYVSIFLQIQVNSSWLQVRTRFNIKTKSNDFIATCAILL